LQSRRSLAAALTQKPGALVTASDRAALRSPRPEPAPAAFLESWRDRRLISRRALPRRVQIALKPTPKTLGLHRVFIRGKGLKYMFADSAFKRVQVDARAYRRDTGEPHRRLAPWAGGTLNCSAWNDGRQGLRRHDASLETKAGAQHSLSPVMPRRRSGDCSSMRP